MKKFVLGFIMGAFLFSVLPIYAATQQAITVNYNNIKLSVRGTIVPTDTEPFIYDNRTFVPIRFVAESLGMDVKYNEITDTVEITDKATPTPTPGPTATPTPEPKPNPEATPTPEPTPEAMQEPNPIEYITFVYAGPNTSNSMDVIYPEPMDFASVTDMTNYKIYDSDKTTLASFQPATASLSESKQAVHITLSSTFDKLSNFYIEISPSVKNADGTKYVKVDKIQFAAKGYTGQ